MKILITGGCGYIGYGLVEKLLPLPSVKKIILYDNLSRKNPGFFIGSRFKASQKIKFIEGNILDNFSLQKALKGVQTVIHLAAKATTPFADHHAHEFDQVNHWGTACLVDALEKVEDVKKLVYLSSIGVYGNSDGELINEDTSPNPRSFYGKSKLRGEEQINRLTGNKEFTIIRGGNVYGYNPCMRMDAVMNKLMYDANFKSRVHITGSGNQKRAFLHIYHLIDILTQLIVGQVKYPQLFNLISRNLSINEIVDSINSLYPDLEKVYLDRHMQMRSIAAETKYEAVTLIDDTTLETELKEIKLNFSF